MSRWIYALPVAGFAVLAFFLFHSLWSGAPDVLPSALIDKPAPAIGPTVLDAATPGFSRADLAAGHVTVINFFASWCVPCRMESTQLMALAKMPGITLYGVDYEERAPGAGRAFLDELGDPFSRIVTDPHGAAGINWGVYGVPETYFIDRGGIVRWRYAGALTDDVVASTLNPLLAKYA